MANKGNVLLKSDQKNNIRKHYWPANTLIKHLVQNSKNIFKPNLESIILDDLSGMFFLDETLGAFLEILHIFLCQAASLSDASFPVVHCGRKESDSLHRSF